MCYILLRFLLARNEVQSLLPIFAWAVFCGFERIDGLLEVHHEKFEDEA